MCQDIGDTQWGGVASGQGPVSRRSTPEGGRSVAELAATQGVHRSWIYRLLARYREFGEEGLVPRSRRPKRSPTAISFEVENEIVLPRNQLSEEGHDAGADESSAAHLNLKGPGT